jgi:L-fuculose-phosphate aldolase
MEYEDLRKQVVDAGLKMHRKGLTHGTSGNISCRVPQKEKMLITPSNISYEQIQEKDIMLVNFAGESEETGRNPSSETPFHLMIYKNREDIGGIVHSHSVYALAVATSRKTVPVFLDEMFSEIGGELEVSEYALPGSDELASNILTKLRDKNALLLANHGTVCCGKDLEEAFWVAETVEKICRIFVLSSILGGVHPLPDEGTEYQRMMYEMRKEL